ncbi:MAG: PBP1A family penicillin-binding protein [Bacillota bacterium]
MYVYEQYKEVEHLTANLDEFMSDLSSEIYDARGNKIYTLVPSSGENRTYTPIKQIPKHVQDAVVASEDVRFWHHKGIDPYRIIGAVWADLKYFLTGRGVLQGASTITQQLARNQFLTLDQTVERKVKEMILALKLERVYTKEEILERYLNEVHFGGSAYGIYAAAQYYFGKTPDQLTLAEGAMLAGILPAPNALNPYVDFDEAKRRQEIVLDLMARWGFITPEQAAAAKAEKLTLAGQRQPAQQAQAEAPEEGQPIDFTGAHYVDYVINILTTPGLAEQYGIQPFDDRELYRGGYKIYTAMDPDLQRLAEETLRRVMNEQAKNWKQLQMDPEHPEEWIQGAMVVKEVKTGRVRAIVGGRTHQTMRELNRATDVRRQPGSTFKPIAVYVPAIELLGYGPGTAVDDAPLRWDPELKQLWPENFEKSYEGLIPLWRAVAQSKNAAAINVLNKVGVERAVAVAEALGIRSLVKSGPANDMNLAMGLGGLTQGVTLLEMTDAFSTIANLGQRIDPVVIEKIVDRNGTVIYEARPQQRQVIKPSTAYLMIQAMKETIRQGTARGRTGGFNGWPFAGKTGTTERNVDAWFLGFSTDLVVGVWNGYDNRDKPRYLPYTGAYVPVSIWYEFMKQVYKDGPPADWPRPQNVVEVEICEKTGLLPSPLCPKTTRALFAAESQPTQYDVDWWQAAYVVQETVTRPNGETTTVWKLWQPGCPGQPEQRVFLVRPPFPRHPTDPYNPRYVPKDVAMALPTEYCTPAPGGGAGDQGSLLPLPDLPWLPGGGNGPGTPGEGGQPGQPPDQGTPGQQPPGQGGQMPSPGPGGTQPPGDQPPVQQPPPQGGHPPQGQRPPEGGNQSGGGQTSGNSGHPAGGSREGPGEGGDGNGPPSWLNLPPIPRPGGGN